MARGERPTAALAALAGADFGVERLQELVSERFGAEALAGATLPPGPVGEAVRDVLPGPVDRRGDGSSRCSSATSSGAERGVLLPDPVTNAAEPCEPGAGAARAPTPRSRRWRGRA
ncbi:MAG: hypothetical protein R3F59_02945 [Myxococcota bacterium]